MLPINTSFPDLLFERVGTAVPVPVLILYIYFIIGVSSPIVKKGRVIGFTDDWFAQRKWPVDMAGFAVNLEFLRYAERYDL